MENKGREERSCIDCGLTGCRSADGATPPFCTMERIPPETMEQVLERYQEPENHRITCASAEVEREGYGQWPRIREIMEFARKMGYHKLGIATCVGLLRESRIAADILRSNGFAVFGIACKAGRVPKTEVGIDPRCAEVGCNMCNPILQAEMLNREGTELNIVVGLCVGHDSLFYKYSQAPTTTLVTKDRVTGHNPAAALYTAGSYYKKLYGREGQS